MAVNNSLVPQANRGKRSRYGLCYLERNPLESMNRKTKQRLGLDSEVGELEYSIDC